MLPTLSLPLHVPKLNLPSPRLRRIKSSCFEFPSAGGKGCAGDAPCEGGEEVPTASFVGCRRAGEGPRGPELSSWLLPSLCCVACLAGHSGGSLEKGCGWELM